MRLIFLAPLLAAISLAAHAEPLSFDEALVCAIRDEPSLLAQALEVDARRSATTVAGQRAAIEVHLDPRVAQHAQVRPRLASQRYVLRNGRIGRTMSPIGAMPAVMKTWCLPG